jgi:hypothetical protein
MTPQGKFLDTDQRSDLTSEVVVNRCSLLMAFICILTVIPSWGQTPHDSATSNPQSSGISAPSPIQFNGTTRLWGQSSNRQGLFQSVPPSFVRWDLSSILSFYGVPISINALVTSEQKYTDQKLNYFSIGLSQADLQQQVRTRIAQKVSELQELAQQKVQQGIAALTDSLRAYSPEKLKDLLQVDNIDKLRELQNLKPSDLERRMHELVDMGITSASAGIASLFPTLALGTMFPQYSSLTLGGIPVTGIDVEFTPGPFYLAFTTGAVLEATPGLGSLTSLLTKSAFSRRITAGRFGLGSKDDTHLYFTGLFGRDDAESLTRDSIDQRITPKANTVLGSEGKLLLFDDRLSLQGEGAISLMTDDVEGAELSDSGIPPWIQKLFKPNVTSSYDYAFSFQGAFALSDKGTTVSALVTRVGPGFMSMGVPYLRRDILRYEGKLEQRLFDRQASVSAYYRRDKDNLIPWKQSQTTVSALGVQMALNFRNLPYLRFSYAPLSQQNQSVADSLKIENSVSILSAMSGYTFRTDGGIVSSTNVSFISQGGKTATAAGDYSNTNLMINQSVSFDFPLSFSAVGGVTSTRIDTTTTRMTNIDFSGTYTALDVWQNTFGVSLTRDAVKRTSFFFNTLVPLGQIATFTAAFEKTAFDDPAIPTNNFNEVVFRFMLSRSW